MTDGGELHADMKRERDATLDELGWNPGDHDDEFAGLKELDEIIASACAPGLAPKDRAGKLVAAWRNFLGVTGPGVFTRLAMAEHVARVLKAHTASQPSQAPAPSPAAKPAPSAGAKIVRDTLGCGAGRCIAKITVTFDMALELIKSIDAALAPERKPTPAFSDTESRGAEIVEAWDKKWSATNHPDAEFDLECRIDAAILAARSRSYPKVLETGWLAALCEQHDVSLPAAFARDVCMEFAALSQPSAKLVALVEEWQEAHGTEDEALQYRRDSALRSYDLTADRARAEADRAVVREAIAAIRRECPISPATARVWFALNNAVRAHPDYPVSAARGEGGGCV